MERSSPSAALTALFALLLIAGCSSPGQKSPPPPRAEDAPPVASVPARSGENSASSPAPPAARGPASGHVPVPPEMGNWAASGSTPEEAGRSFAAGGGCDCDQVEVTTITSEGDRATIRVVLRGLKDDSIRDMEYLVVVRRADDQWRVDSATFRTECRQGRGISPDGYCS